MKNTEITAKTKKPERTVAVKINLPESLEEAVETWGAKVVHNQCMAAVVIAAQARMRSLMVDKLDKDGNVTTAALGDDAIQTELGNWKPGEKTIVRKSPVDKLKELMAGMSPEDKAALLAQAAETLDEEEEEVEEEEAE